MPYIIEVAHTSHRYLTSVHNRLVVQRIEPGAMQTWDIVDSDEPPYKIIRSAINHNLCIVSPNAVVQQAILSPLNELRSTDLAKWDIVPVCRLYGIDYPGANEHDFCVFIQSKQIPRTTGARRTQTAHELAVMSEKTHNRTTVVLFNHKQRDVKEPRNHMWLLRAST